MRQDDEDWADFAGANRPELQDPMDVAAEAQWRRTWDIVNRQLGEKAPANTVRWEDMPETHKEVWRAVIHRPQRGSDIETWLKTERDMFVPGSNPADKWAYAALDALLDEYRLRADTGLLLHQDIGEAGP